VVVVASKYGRLGNRLFVYANVVAAAEEHGFEVWNPSFDEYAPLFPATAGDPLCRYPARRSRLPARCRGFAFQGCRALAEAAARASAVRRVVQVVRLGSGEELDLSDAAFVRAARHRTVLVQGWLLRDAPSLARHADTVRAHFRPFGRDAAEAQQTIQLARRGVEVLVGLHVRRGDYASFEGGRYFWSNTTYGQLARSAVALFPGRRVRVLVCSDEPVHTHGWAGVDVASGPGGVVTDLLVLAACDLLLGPPSTFTAWASFYGGVPLLGLHDPGAPFSLDDFSVAGIPGAAASRTLRLPSVP
jgi:hypothetical protein